MTTTIGSVDLNALSDLYNDSNQYFWFESNPDATYGAGVHITLSPDTSFIANPSGQNVLINTDGISFRNGLLPMMTLDNDSLDFNVINATTGTYNNVASFGSTAIVIGEEANANLHLTFNNLSMVDKDGTTLFEVGDNRNADGIATVKHTETVTVNSAGSATVTVKSNISSIESVYADSVQLSSSKYSFSGKTVTINGLTANSEKTIKITYTTRDSIIYLTVGSRKASGNIGNYSIAEGVDVIASGYASHAEGYATTASGFPSHAEGESTTASYSASHAEGYATTASGAASHAGGISTVADGRAMTAIGKYNTKNSGKAFVVGNGTSDTARSNAFAVDWSGNTVMKGGLTLGTALSIANGGTGATTAAAARSNLGINASNLGIKDYIIEQGEATPTSSIKARWEKWASGKAVMEFAYSGTATASNVWTNPIYYTDYTSFSNVFANVKSGLFIEAPNVIVTSNSHVFIGVIPSNITANGIGSLRYLSVNSKDSSSAETSFRAVGKWK